MSALSSGVSLIFHCNQMTFLRFLEKKNSRPFFFCEETSGHKIKVGLLYNLSSSISPYFPTENLTISEPQNPFSFVDRLMKRRWSRETVGRVEPPSYTQTDKPFFGALESVALRFWTT